MDGIMAADVCKQKQILFIFFCYWNMKTNVAQKRMKMESEREREREREREERKREE